MNDNPWVVFTGAYEKQWYDVRLDTGEIVMHCWPNAGRMVACDGSGREWLQGQCEVRASEGCPW